MKCNDAINNLKNIIWVVIKDNVLMDRCLYCDFSITFELYCMNYVIFQFLQQFFQKFQLYFSQILEVCTIIENWWGKTLFIDKICIYKVYNSKKILIIVELIIFLEQQVYLTRYSNTNRLYLLSMNNQIVLSTKYKYLYDQRTPHQIFLSDNIVRILSEINLSRIRATRIYLKHQFQYSYTFICLTGLPPFQNQYQNIQLPGQKIIYSTPAFKQPYQQKQYEEVYLKASLSGEADKLAEIVTTVPKQNKIIIVFHSFGTYILNNYLIKYGNDKIFGLIDIAGLPITWPSKAIISLKKALSIEKEKQLDFDYSYQKYHEGSIEKNYYHIKNKLHASIYMKMLRQKQFEEMYKNLRDYPPVLKLIFIGKNDNILEQALMNQKAIHYCYMKKLDEKYERNLRKAYFQLYGKEPNNIQQRFVISFSNGSHSMHMQKKLSSDMTKSINQYVRILDQNLKISQI